MVLTTNIRIKSTLWLSVIIISFLSISCISIKTDLVLHRDGRVSATVEYNLSQDFAEFGRGFGADEPWPLPLREKDFRRLAIRNKSLRLRDYKSRQNRDGTEQITLRLDAENFDAFAEYFGWDANLTESESGGQLELLFPDMEGIKNLDKEAGAALENLIGESTMELRIKAPKKPQSVSGGSIEGPYGVFETNFEEVLKSGTSPRWVLSW